MRITMAMVLAVATTACVGPPGSKDDDTPGHAAASGQGSAGAQEFSLCIIDNGALKIVVAAVEPSTGDTLVNGRPLREAHPVTLPPYARDATWLAREIVNLNGRAYAPHGPPQFINPELLSRVGEFRGVPVFAEAGFASEGAGAIFIPIRPGCEFQPYVANVDVM